MPVSNTVRLEMVASAQDKVSAVLRSVQAEVRKTEKSLRDLKQAGDDGNEVDQIFLKAQDRKRSAMADERREKVLAARADREQGSLAERANDRLKSAAAAQEKFNKVLGLTGFVGIIGSAAVGLAHFIESLSPYSRAVEQADAVVDSFTKRLQELKDVNNEFALRDLTEAQLAQVESAKKLFEETSKIGTQQAERARLEAGLNAALKEQARTTALLISMRQFALMQGGNDLLTRNQQAEANRKIAQFGALINASLAAEAQGLKVVKTFADEASDAYAERAGIAKSIVDDAKRTLDAVKPSIDLARKAADDAFRKGQAEKEAAKQRGAAYAERVRGLERELQLEQAAGDLEKAALARSFIMEDRARGRLSAREAELQLRLLEQKAADQVLDTIQKAAEADEQKRGEDTDRVRALRQEITLLDAKNDRERAALEFKQRLRDINTAATFGDISPEVAALERELEVKKRDKEVEADRLDDRAKRITNIGNAARGASEALSGLSSGLGAITDAIGGAADIWAKFDAANDKLGSTIAATFGVMGKSLAGAIKNKRIQAAVEGAFEEAAAIASFASLDIPQGIAHQAAAAAFFAVAAGAGGGSGRRSSAGGAAAGGGARDGHGHRVAGDTGGAYNGPPNITIVAGPGTDPQSVVREFNRLYWSARGTGERAAY